MAVPASVGVIVSLVAAIVVLVTLHGRSSQSTTPGGSVPFKGESAADVPSPSPSDNVAPTFSPITLSGTGQQATRLVALPAGGYRVTMTNGDSADHFSVWLKDGSGNDVDLLVNQLTPATNSKVTNVPGGNYVFDVEAGGTWTIQVEAL